MLKSEYRTGNSMSRIGYNGMTNKLIMKMSGKTIVDKKSFIFLLPLYIDGAVSIVET
jgi:hypothetical protein